MKPAISKANPLSILYGRSRIDLTKLEPERPDLERVRALEAERLRRDYSAVPFYAERAAKWGADYWRISAGSFMMGATPEDVKAKIAELENKLQPR